jgi:hypothetical protein
MSYRPNHVDGRGSNLRTAQIAPEGCLLGPGGPRLLLTHLHIVILKQQGEYLKRIIKETPKKKGD